jgi:hypothetical protein
MLAARIPPELRAAVDYLAQKDKRNIGAETEYILEKYVIEHLGENYKQMFAATGEGDSHAANVPTIPN